MRLNFTLHFLFIILVFYDISEAKTPIPKSLDSIIEQDYNTIYQKCKIALNEEFNIEKAKLYARAYLSKAKKNNNLNEVVYGYILMTSTTPHLNFDDKIKYIDSCISTNKLIKNKSFPILPYVLKGTAYDGQGLFSDALDSYLTGLELAKKHKKIDFEMILNHNIALLKRKLGKFREAKSLFKECLKYEKSALNTINRDSTGYLTTLAELTTTYWKNKEIDSANNLNNNGLRLSKNMPTECLFELNKGVIEYHQSNYEEANITLTNALKKFIHPFYEDHTEIYNFIHLYLFLGKSLNSINRKQDALIYYKKIDSIFSKTNYVIPETRDAYIGIINYYKTFDEKNEQLYYINRLLYCDSLLNKNYRGVSYKLSKEYDTPKILNEKEKLISELKSKNNKSNYGLIVALLIIVLTSIAFYVNYRKNRYYKYRYDELMKSQSELANSISEKGRVNQQPEVKQRKIDIADNVVNMILNGLESFEKNKKFTEVNITSGLLAKELNTNSKYLTNVIKHFKSKSFTSYINDLRIEFVIKELKTNQKLQDYTIKALANEVGFNSAEVFSKYFHKKTGIYPSYFIRRLKKEG